MTNNTTEASSHHHDDDDEGGTQQLTIRVIENIDSINNSSNNTDDDDPIAINNHNDNNNDDDEVIISASILSEDDTSATSLASTLSDGIARPRSASVNIIVNNVNNNDSDHLNRPSSIPRLRPRSNPRTRTPMRHESPLLVTSPVLVVENSNNDNGSGRRIGGDCDADDNERMIRNLFHNSSSSSARRGHRSRRLRAGSIPEEEDVDTADIIDNNINASAAAGDATLVAASDNAEGSISRTHQVNNGSNSTQAASVNSNNTSRAAGHLFIQAAVSTTSTRRRHNNNTTSIHTTTSQQQHRTLSTKQFPSHRKIRRWKNDAFIGTPLEQIHSTLLLHPDIGDGNGNEWKFPYMPNYPCNYTSEFRKLVNVDESDKRGMVVRERFVRGEVATAVSVTNDVSGGGGDKDGGKESLECKIGLKFRQLGISSKMMSEKKKNTEKDEEDVDNEVLLLEKILFDKLGSRIQSILSRSCHNVVDDSAAMGSSAAGVGDEVTMINMASRIVAAFESYLVSLALHSSNRDNDGKDDNDCMMGYPPLQSQNVYDIFDEILASSPRIVIRDKKSGYHHNNRCRDGSGGGSELNTDMNKFGVLIPTIHFYFPAEDDNSSSSRKSAFHRILLYAVSQFHGLETSSSVIAPDKKKSGNKKKKQKDHRGNDAATRRRSGKQQRQQNDAKGSIKVVTVEGGVLLAPSVKLLDCI